MITKKEHNFIAENVEDLLCCESFNELEYRFSDSITARNKREVWNAVQLAKKLMEYKAKKRLQLNSPNSVYNFLKCSLQHLKHEEFIVLTLNSKNELIKKHIASKGSLNSSIVHPREVFKTAILDSAASIIVAHNHPSGNVKPSREDKNITEKLVAAGENLCIPVLDHIIIGDEYYSFKEQGII